MNAADDGGHGSQASTRSLCAGARADELRQQLGRRLRGRELRRPVPDLRHQGGPAGLGGRAAVLLRPGRGTPVDRSSSIHAQTRRTGSTGKSRGLTLTRSRARRSAGRADQADRRRPPVRDRMAVGLPLPVPVCGPHAGRPGAARRRRAHLYAPFGARGLNSGVPDAENAAWKLAFVLHGWAPEALLESYHDERHAAAENLEVTSATMRFLVPPDELLVASTPCRSRRRRSGQASASRLRPLRRTLLVRRFAAHHP